MDYSKILMDKYLLAFDDDPNMESSRVEKRFNHSVSVVNALKQINDFYKLGLDEEKLEKIGYFHDYAKFCSIEDYKRVLIKFDAKSDEHFLDEASSIHHGVLGYLIVRDELGIKDESILNAIKYHTIASNNMDIYAEVLYCADFTESLRNGEVFDVARRYLYQSNELNNLYKTIAFIIRSKIKKCRSNGYPILKETLDAYEKYKKYIEEPIEKVKAIIRAIDHNLVEDIRVYDIRNKNPLADFSIVASVGNNRSMEACISYVRAEFDIRNAERGEFWTLIDLNDVILHIFTKEQRIEYNLDNLLGEEMNLEEV